MSWAKLRVEDGFKPSNLHPNPLNPKPQTLNGVVVSLVGIRGSRGAKQATELVLLGNLYWSPYRVWGLGFRV